MTWLQRDEQQRQRDAFKIATRASVGRSPRRAGQQRQRDAFKIATGAASVQIGASKSATTAARRLQDRDLPRHYRAPPADASTAARRLQDRDPRESACAIQSRSRSNNGSATPSRSRLSTESMDVTTTYQRQRDAFEIATR